MPDPKYEVYHGDNGLIDEFDTLEDAEKCAEDLICEDRKEAERFGGDGLWGDNTRSIEIRYRYTVQRSFPITETDDYGDEYTDFQMRAVVDHRPLELKQ